MMDVEIFESLTCIKTSSFIVVLLSELTSFDVKQWFLPV